ncbi:TPA: ImmA/IrrE family metallo-endopeptidase [Bacillus cereus]
MAGIRYKVKQAEQLILDGEPLQGICRFDKTNIEVLKHLSDDRKREVLIHELTHAIFNESELMQDEEVVTYLARVLYQVLKDNNFDWLRDS